MRYILLSILVFVCLNLPAQNWLEDFETDDLTGWEQLIGIADLSKDSIVNGNNSLRLWNFQDKESPIATLIHKTFQGDFGTYSFYAMGEGPTSDADFYFQYQDSINYYHVSHKAEGTDNPEFTISKVIKGIHTLLYNGTAVEERGKWVYISIERFCSGRMIVSSNNDNILDFVDTDILAPGTIGLGSLGSYTFFDRIEFEPYEAQVVELDETICFGSDFNVGPKKYDLAGSYRDTLSSVSGCDSIIQLELEILDSIVVEIDTAICQGATLVFNNQTIGTVGAYKSEYVTDGGCDSIVRWRVTESPKFTLGPDRAICDSDILISANRQRSYLWNTGETSSELIIEKEGTYSIEIVDNNNCTQADTIQVITKCELKVFLPNVFTPNEDNIHDTWKPGFDFLPINYKLSIFDEWGNLIFQTDDPLQSWNGKFKDKNVEDGIYVCKVIADQQYFIGDILVMR